MVLMFVYVNNLATLLKNNTYMSGKVFECIFLFLGCHVYFIQKMRFPVQKQHQFTVIQNLNISDR